MRHLDTRKAIFHPMAREALKQLSEEAKDKIGFAIFKLQLGEKLVMPLSRPMPSVALGIEELRIRCGDGSCRVFYYLKSSRGILIVHIFEKKTQKTPAREVDIGRKRLKEMLHEEI